MLDYSLLLAASYNWGHGEVFPRLENYILNLKQKELTKNQPKIIKTAGKKGAKKNQPQPIKTSIEGPLEIRLPKDWDQHLNLRQETKNHVHAIRNCMKAGEFTPPVPGMNKKCAGEYQIPTVPPPRQKVKLTSREEEVDQQLRANGQEKFDKPK